MGFIRDKVLVHSVPHHRGRIGDFFIDRAVAFLARVRPIEARSTMVRIAVRAAWSQPSRLSHGV